MAFAMNFTKYISRIHGLILLVPVLGLSAGLLFGKNFALFSGPFAGAIARDWQSCCAEISFDLSYWVLGVIAIGAILQFLIKPGEDNWIRYTLWIVSFLPWFASSVPSLLHAIS